MTESSRNNDTLVTKIWDGKLLFSYHQDSGGRSGHVLKDLFSSVVVARLFGGSVAYNESWERQSLLPLAGVKQVLDTKTPFSDDTTLVVRPKVDFWGGLSFGHLLQFEKWLEENVKRGRNTCVQLRGVFRIHLSQVHNWELQKRIPQGTFLSLVSDLRKMYWNGAMPNQTDWPPRRVAIHVRRGDVADPKHREFRKMGPGGVWNSAFYQKCIDQLAQEFPDCKIELHSEIRGSEDIQKLSGAELHLGRGQDLLYQVRSMLTADLFVPANSSLSTWLCYLTKGRVRIYHSAHIKHFTHSDYPSNLSLIHI